MSEHFPSAQPAPAWDGKLPDTLQKSLNALYLECPEAVVSEHSYHVRSAFEAICTSLATTQRMFKALQAKVPVDEGGTAAPAATQAQAELVTAWAPVTVAQSPERAAAYLAEARAYKPGQRDARPAPQAARISPCPFCGDPDAEEQESTVPTITGGQKRAVYCNACFCEGPTADTADGAIAAWNRRAPSAPVGDGAATEQAEAQGVEAALAMLERIDTRGEDDDARVDAIAATIRRLAKDVHDLNWALGTPGYEQMHDPADQADHEAAVRGSELFLQRMAAAKERHDAMEADAARYRFLRDSPDAMWRPYALRTGGNAADVDALVDAARAAQAGQEVAACGCTPWEQQHCRADRSPFAEHPRCVRMQSAQAGGGNHA